MINKLLKLFKKYEEVIRYLIVGVLTTVVSLGSYALFTTFLLNPNKGIQLQIANILSWICAVLFAFFANKKYVFKSENKEVFKEMFHFVDGRILTLVLDMIIMQVLVILLHFNDKIAKLIVQVIVTILNYIISKLFVFKKNNN